VARFDQIHAGGTRAVLELASLTPISTGQRVVDLGAGLGGAARVLTDKFRCQSVCVELAPRLAAAGKALTALVGFGARVSHVAGDAARTPFTSTSFDGVWVQHLALHFPDSTALWREAARLLRPGGWLAFHEWLRGGGPELLFPSPWSPKDGSLSYLDGSDTLTSGLTQSGFGNVHVVDVSAVMAERYRRQLAALRAQPGVSNPILPGGEALMALENAEQNLREARATCVMGVAYRLSVQCADF
jgi:SAM-dependent methyltransferase